MPPLAQRNLFHDKVRLTVTLTGIVFSVVLIVVQLGLFLGFTTATSNLIDHSNADLWITSKNVPYVEQGVAFSERKLNQVRAVPGVGDAQKLIARWTQWKRHGADFVGQHCAVSRLAVAIQSSGDLGLPRVSWWVDCDDASQSTDTHCSRSSGAFANRRTIALVLGRFKA